MSQFIQAIYEGGVFRLFEPVELADHKQVSPTVSEAGASVEKAAASAETASIAMQRQSLADLRAEIGRLPDRAPIDG